MIGPLTLRQFVYAIIVAVSGFIAFKIIVAGAWYIAALFLPHMIFFTVLAAPFGHDQSSEVWLLAKVRFFLKPRKRIWNQDGMQELVTITVPKLVERHLTKNLSQTEVRSRLHALANTIDSRGWAVKNVNVNLFSEPSYVMAGGSSDRLLDPSTLPQDVPTFDVQPVDDMFDSQISPTGQRLEQMMTASAQTHKQQVIQQMRTPAPQKSDPPADYWFLNGPDPSQAAPPGMATFTKSQVIAPGQNDANHPVPTAAATPSVDEQAVLEKIQREKSKPNPAYGHTRTIQPLSATPKSPQSPVSSPQSLATSDKRQATTPAGVNPAIIELANNDDLNVATIARQADKATRKEPPTDEVVISLR